MHRRPRLTVLPRTDRRPGSERSSPPTERSTGCRPLRSPAALQRSSCSRRLLLLNLRAVKPVRRMSDFMKVMATGRLFEVRAGSSPRRRDRRDGGSVEVFKAAGIERRRLEEEAAAGRLGSEADQRRQAEYERAKQQELQAFVADIERGFEALSQATSPFVSTAGRCRVRADPAALQRERRQAGRCVWEGRRRHRRDPHGPFRNHGGLRRPGAAYRAAGRQPRTDRRRALRRDRAGQ